jgi:hypothetical protein
VERGPKGGHESRRASGDVSRSAASSCSTCADVKQEPEKQAAGMQDCSTQGTHRHGPVGRKREGYEHDGPPDANADAGKHGSVSVSPDAWVCERSLDGAEPNNDARGQDRGQRGTGG